MNKDMIIGLMIGLTIGWLVEWMIDYLYWRRRNARIIKNCKDELILIDGIGPAIEERLNKADIYTFKQMAAMKPKEVRNIIGKAQNLADEKSLIHQARKFAKLQKPKKSRKGK
jgi:hypothetical protein